MASLSSYFFSMARYVQNARNGQKYATESAANALASAQNASGAVSSAHSNENSINSSAEIIRAVQPYLPAFDIDVSTMNLVETSGYMENPNRPLDFYMTDGTIYCDNHERTTND